MFNPTVVRNRSVRLGSSYHAIAMPFFNYSLFTNTPTTTHSLSSHTHTRIIRFLYIAYVIVLQAFLLYVRLQAKSLNNRTPIQMTNPFSKILESTQNHQVKNLASSLLTSQSTILEYDLAQIKSMNGGLLIEYGLPMVPPLQDGTDATTVPTNCTREC
jgi:hypothetical protein